MQQFAVDEPNAKARLPDGAWVEPAEFLLRNEKWPQSATRIVCVELSRDPEDHAGFFTQFGGKFFDAAVLHTCGHAVLHARRFEAFPGEMRTEDASLRRKGQIRQVQPAVGQPLLHFEHLDAPDAGRVIVFLGAGEFAGVAPRAVFVIDQQAEFGFPFFHAIHPAPGSYKPCRADS